ncbi:MarR family transcriptional regulator [Runella sp.]|jgi:DNA-binding MarR family transcriptional regulator|uniref:MarR family winged helix-turn-helix transcriptional regulator n=1 Tax=Runella sp. TaxID=1960881 RepID=UPI00260518EA|nr:MarR family transcriptional regulator [Runella sp.]
MSIETDIKQTKFRNPHHRMALNLLYTTNWLSNSQACLLKPYDLTPQQYNVLRILRGQYPKPVRVNDIIERMLDKMSNASRLVDKLLLKALVKRTECPHDRRAVDVVITEAGLEILSELDKMQESWENQLKRLSEQEADLLSELIDKLRGSVEMAD